MSDIDSTSSTSSELSAGFSTPPSSSLDTCDSGFNDLYSNSFTILSSSSSSKCSRTTPAQIDQSDSLPEPEQLLFDENSITATEPQLPTTSQHNTGKDVQIGAATAVDRPPSPPPPSLPPLPTTPSSASSSSLPASSSSSASSSSRKDEAQFDLTTSLDYSNQHTTNACERDTPSSVMANKAKYSRGDNDADDYNDDSNMSDISDLSDVFKLNSDIMPEMQRSIDWVILKPLSNEQIMSVLCTVECAIFSNSKIYTITPIPPTGSHANRIRRKSARLPVADICE